MADTARAVVRHIIMLLCFWLPAPRRKQLERWLRGREEFKKLQRSDWVLMSWGCVGSVAARDRFLRLGRRCEPGNQVPEVQVPTA